MARSSTSFAPGRSGNPSGRPRTGNTVAETVRTTLDGDDDGVPRKERLVLKLYTMALEGSTAAARLLLDAAGNVEIEERIAALESAIGDHK